MTSGDTLFTIAPIDAAQTHPLRAMILLNGDLDASALAGDLAPTTLHVGVRDASGIVAVASLCEVREDDPARPAWRLRGWPSTLPCAGFGRVLVQVACGTRASRGRARVVQHARPRTGSMKSSASRPMTRRSRCRARRYGVPCDAAVYRSAIDGGLTRTARSRGQVESDAARYGGHPPAGPSPSHSDSGFLRAPQHRTQQHVGARRRPLGRNRFGFVVAQPVDARHEIIPVGATRAT